jgi:hypothetical protein
MVTGKADSLELLEGTSPRCAMANTGDTTGVDERGMCIKG